jgi:hypothetical protein
LANNKSVLTGVIQGRYNEKGDIFHFVSAEWKVDGGGHWALDEEGGTRQLSGSSKSYGEADLHALDIELRQTDAFRGVRVVIVQRATIL